MKNIRSLIRSLSLELIVLASIGLIVQNIFLPGGSFYNNYLGFSLLFPLYALIFSWLIEFFKLKNKLYIIAMSVLLLAVVTFINITLYPIMGGATGQLFGFWALFVIMPVISLPLGLLYGAYKLYTNRKKTFEDTNVSQMETSTNSNTIDLLWFVSLFMICIFPYFIINSHSFGAIYVQLLFPSSVMGNPYLRILVVLMSMIVGAGLLLRNKWMRWIMLFLVYFAIVNYAIIIVRNTISFSLQPQSLVAFSIPIWFIYILNREASFLKLQLNKAPRFKENTLLAILAVVFVSFEITIHKLLNA